MGFANCDHGCQDGIPCFDVFKGFVGEHATVPADVFDTARGGIFEPVTRAFDDIEFSVWIIGTAVFTGLVVRTGTVDLSIVLSDVEVDGPRPQFVGHLLVLVVEFFLGVVIAKECVFGCVVTQKVEVGVCQVGLEAEGLWHPDPFENIEHVFPGVHSGPADFSFGG